MLEYRVKGLSCINCTRELEEQIQKLEHGQRAQLSYNSGKLLVDERTPIEKIEKILRSDGAYIVKPNVGERIVHQKDAAYAHNHDHGHDHGASNRGLLYQLILATVLYVVAMLTEGQLLSWVFISLYLIAIAISGYRTFWKGLKNLFRLKFNIDTLMTIALTGAIAIGEWKEATLVAILFGLNEVRVYLQSTFKLEDSTDEWNGLT